MPRIRSIKPEFWTSEQVADVSIGARLLFIATWTFADDAGRLPWRPRQLKMRAFGADDVTADDVDGWLRELAGVGLIRRYEVDGDAYLHVTGWDRHQRIDKRSEPVHPAPPSHLPDLSTNGPAKTASSRPSNPTPQQEPSTTTPGALPDSSTGGRDGEMERGRDLSEGEREIARAPEGPRPAGPKRAGDVAAGLGLGRGRKDDEAEEAAACVQAYTEKLPELQAATPPSRWSERRRAHWRALRQDLGDDRPQDLDDWRTYFGAVAESDFLCGRTSNGDGRPPFKADLTWLLDPQHVKAVMAGRYDPGRPGGRRR